MFLLIIFYCFHDHSFLTSLVCFFRTNDVKVVAGDSLLDFYFITLIHLNLGGRLLFASFLLHLFDSGRLIIVLA